MVDIIKILDQLPESASMKMGKLARKMEKKSKIINLGIGDPFFPTPKLIMKKAYQYMLLGKTHYVDDRGIEDLRVRTSEYLRKRFNVSYSPDEIIITPGSKQGIYYAVNLLGTRGMNVGLFEPCWLGYVPAIKLAGGKNKFLSLEKRTFSEKVADELKKENINLIILNNPNNPDGKVWSKKELILFVDTCKKLKIKIIADEVYNELIYKKIFYSLGLFNKVYKDIIIAGSFSKTLAMTGWRMGYLCCKDKLLMKRLIKLQQIIATCPTSFTQYAIADSWEKCRKETEKMKRIFQKNRDILFSALKNTRLEPFLPRGTFYMWVNVKEDGEKFTQKLIEKLKIIVVPGKDYGIRVNNFIRISFGCPTKDIIEACKRFKNEFQRS